MTTSSSSPKGDVTEEDIRAFKLSPLMRRFPELKNMSDEEVAQMVAYNNQTGGHKQELPTKTRPKTEFQSTARTKVMTNSPVFYPVNPAQAKEDAKRPDSESFVGVGTPYDADHTELLEAKTSDEVKRCPLAPFKPTSVSQARKSISLR